jgi:hypothetical protein
MMIVDDEIFDHVGLKNRGLGYGAACKFGKGEVRNTLPQIMKERELLLELCLDGRRISG